MQRLPSVASDHGTHADGQDLSVVNDRYGASQCSRQTSARAGCVQSPSRWCGMLLIIVAAIRIEGSLSKVVSTMQQRMKTMEDTLAVIR
jgi:hypothetical protein